MLPNRKNIRLHGYDYSSEGCYFITICTKNRKHFFGRIKDQKFEFSPIGDFAHGCWNEIPIHFPQVQLGEFIIMPNHIHGIIEISSSFQPSQLIVRTRHGVSPQESPQIPPLSSSKNLTEKSSKSTNEFGRTIPGSISAIIGQFKSSVTRWCNKNDLIFAWHSRFHDHIIRDEMEYDRIEKYIVDNVMNWKGDKFYD